MDKEREKKLDSLLTELSDWADESEKANSLEKSWKLMMRKKMIL